LEISKNRIFKSLKNNYKLLSHAKGETNHTLAPDVLQSYYKCPSLPRLKVYESMETNPTPNRIKQRGKLVRFEPQSMELLNANPVFRDSFQQVGCLRFCEKLKGHHVQVDKNFVLNFIGKRTKVGPLEFDVTVDSISARTEIP